MEFVIVIAYALFGVFLGAVLWGIEDEEDAAGWALLWPFLTLICIGDTVRVCMKYICKLIKTKEKRHKSDKTVKNVAKNRHDLTGDSI